MIDRRTFLVTGSVGILTTLYATPGEANKVPRIGVLSPFPSSYGPGPSFGAFHQTFHGLGYAEGRNVALEYRWADGHADRLADLAADLVRLPVDIIFSAYGTPAALASRKATSSIPIVFAGVGDAVGVGLVASLARPGGNATGSTFIGEETIGKQLEFLKQIVPRITRVGAVVNLTNPVYGPVLRASEEPARALGLQLVAISVQSAEDFEPSIQAAIRKHVGGLIVQRDSVLFTNRPRLLAQVAANRLPAIYGAREFTENGGLMSYGPDLADMYRRAAYLIDQILRGAKPSELPVEQATRFELVINLKTAKALGLTILQTLLLRADQVIE